MGMPKCPALAVDIICRWRGKIILIERKNKPYGLALPGGFVDIGETVETAVLRELKEETNITGKIISFVGVYSDPARDPRGHIISLAYAVAGNHDDTPKPLDDAKEVGMVSFSKVLGLQLIADHKQILTDAINSVFDRRIYG
jgi:8-oxo-dGTP diphosphatase